MSDCKEVMLRAVEAGLNGDAEALWVVKLLLTANVVPLDDETPHGATTRH